MIKIITEKIAPVLAYKSDSAIHKTKVMIYSPQQAYYIISALVLQPGYFYTLLQENCCTGATLQKRRSDIYVD